MVRVWDLPGEKETEPNRVALYNIANHFQKQHPGVRLESSSHLQVEGASVDAAMLMQIAGGNAPDVLPVAFRQSDAFIREGFLYPLDEYIAQLSPEELAEHIPAKVRPVVHRPGPRGAEHYWAYPAQLLATVLFYRKDYFAEAGLDPDYPPRNWEELEACAKAVADPATGRYGLAFGAGWTLTPYLRGAGAELVRQKQDGQWEAAFDTPQAVAAFSFVDRLLKTEVTRNGKSGPIAYRGVDFYQVLRQGKIAMFFGYLGGTDVALANPDVTGVAVVPHGPNGDSGTELNARMYGIFSGTRDKRVRDMAWEYIRFLGSEEAKRIYTQTMIDLGSGHLVNPAWLERFGHTDLVATIDPGLRQVIETSLAEGEPESFGRSSQLIYLYLIRPLDKMLLRDFSGLSAAEREQEIRHLLEDAVRHTNERLFGEVPRAVQLRQSLIAWLALGLVAAGFVVLIRVLLRQMQAGESFRLLDFAQARFRIPLLLLLPALLLIVMWHYYPLARGSLMAFQDFKILEPARWTGSQNFADVLFDGEFWLSMRNALYFCALWMLMGFLPPFILAILLQEIPLGKITFRLLFYLPAVVSGVVILFMWRGLYDPSPDGALNRLLGTLHLPAQTWLQDPMLAMICVVFPLAWAHLGPGCIVYLAALKGIPDELYEAADIDGAGLFGKIRWILIPYMRPLLVINGVGATIFGFKSTDAVLAMTGGGPDLATQVVGYEIWQRTFIYLKFGQGTAMAWILGLLLMSLTVYQMRILARVEFRTAR